MSKTTPTPSTSRCTPSPPTRPQRPVLQVDTHAPLEHLYATADSRIRMARHLLECIEGADDCDVRHIASSALMLLGDGCAAMAAVERHIPVLTSNIVA